MTTATTTKASTDVVVNNLNSLLADGHIFYQRLRHFHWNVTGPRFFQLHDKFEDLYTRWAEHNDNIAERVLQLDETPLPTMAAMVENADLKEVADIPSHSQMVAKLQDDITHLCEKITETIGQAEEVDDRSTANLLDDILDELQEDRWMLRAFLKD